MFGGWVRLKALHRQKPVLLGRFGAPLNFWWNILFLVPKKFVNEEGPTEVRVAYAEIEVGSRDCKNVCRTR